MINTQIDIVIIPTFNEKANISILIKEIFDAAPLVHVLVVDDNSPDGTGEIVSSLKEVFPNLDLFSREKKEGLGKAYLAAFRKVLEDTDLRSVVMMDADLSHHPKHLKEMLKKLETFDVVIGSRYVSGGGTKGWELWRRALSLFGNLYCRTLTRMPIHDCTGGFNAIRAETLRKVDFSGVDLSGYAFIMELKYALFKAGARFAEIPIIFTNRVGGESKMSGHIISEGILAPWKMILKK
ncbi:MAG: polyprenol monophosphomannose synthase [Minisyncoccota bacterium]